MGGGFESASISSFTSDASAEAPDGFHVRHFAHLCDDGLAAFSGVWRCIEATGVFPSQLARVTVPLIPKKSEAGLRPIGALPSLYRLALNVASTRLILSPGHEGEEAAGQVIRAVADFVMQGNFVIGVIVFIILIIVNFVVITKGSTRIA